MSRSADKTFLDFQSDNALGASVAMEFKVAAQRSGRKFIPIYLICDVEENVRRLIDTRRMDRSRNKLQNREILEGMRSRSRLYNFESEGYEIDVTHSQPEEVAKSMLAMIRELS